mgnify:CR=1 FL=1
MIWTLSATEARIQLAHFNLWCSKGVVTLETVSRKNFSVHHKPARAPLTPTRDTLHSKLAATFNGNEGEAGREVRRRGRTMEVSHMRLHELQLQERVWEVYRRGEAPATSAAQ